MVNKDLILMIIIEIVIITTPTSSGKSLCFNIPVLEAILKNPDSNSAMYLFPLNALAFDQVSYPIYNKFIELTMLSGGKIALFEFSSSKRYSDRQNIW